MGREDLRISDVKFKGLKISQEYLYNSFSLIYRYEKEKEGWIKIDEK